MPELEGWDSFYVIVGSAAGALIGLQFVVMTLIADRPPPRAAEAGAAFATPTIIHFSAVLLLSALLRAPWTVSSAVTAVCSVMGAAGVVYAAIVVWRIRSQTAYRPQFEDWLFHALLPLLAYLLLVGSALLLPLHPQGGLFGPGGAALLLLFIGIHNAWDATAWHVYTQSTGQKRDP